MKIAIYNDCDINSYKHFGCELVMETFREQLNRVDCELVGTVTRNRYNNKGHVKKILDKADLVIVNGEGSLHHNRRNDILSVGQKWNSILINTVFQANDGNGLKDFRYFSCRESYSANEAAKAGDINVDVLEVDVALELLDGWLRSLSSWAFENAPLFYCQTRLIFRHFVCDSFNFQYYS